MYDGKICLKRYEGTGRFWYLASNKDCRDLDYVDTDNVKIVDNFIFQADMRFLNIYNGGAHYQTVDISFIGSIFMSGLSKLINSHMPLDIVSGYWCFAKRGVKYRLQYLGAERPQGANIRFGTLPAV